MGKERCFTGYLLPYLTEVVENKLTVFFDDSFLTLLEFYKIFIKEEESGTTGEIIFPPYVVSVQNGLLYSIQKEGSIVYQMDVDRVITCSPRFYCLGRNGLL